MLRLQIYIKLSEQGGLVICVTNHRSKNCLEPQSYSWQRFSHGHELQRGTDKPTDLKALWIEAFNQFNPDFKLVVAIIINKRYPLPLVRETLNRLQDGYHFHAQPATYG